MDLEALKSTLDRLADEATSALAEAPHKEAAIQLKNRYIGRSGQVNEHRPNMRELDHDSKRVVGPMFKGITTSIQAAFDARLEALAEAELERRMADEAIDVTLPGRRPGVRRPHPLRAVEDELIDIFVKMGFDVAEGPEIEEDFYNFEALNFPDDHPARDMQDTFMLTDERLLRTHTSPVQIRTMQAYRPPVAVISPGRVYRVDEDITHSPVFHQIEGLLVDEHVTFADLKGTLRAFVDLCFEPGTPMRFRPSYFPFTEPSAEVDIGCIFCNQEGCRVCSHTGWLEILGCGMVDPNVFGFVDVDPKRYTGYAFGMGVERIAMLKLRIDDIRLFYQNELGFLGQFG